MSTTKTFSFILQLSSIGYEPLLILLLCYALNRVRCTLVIQLTILWCFGFTIDHANYDHSIDQSTLNHSIDSFYMPVTTRSKAKFLERYSEATAVSPLLSLWKTLHDISSSNLTKENLISTSELLILRVLLLLTVMILLFPRVIFLKFQNFKIWNFQGCLW